MAQAQVTIKDIAKRLGISPSTVSRALKDHPNISEKTRKEVQELAKKLRYNPNQVALSLLNSKTNIIGIIIPEIVHHFFSSVISGIEAVAYKAGYKVMICQSNENHEREVLDVQALLSSRVDGMLVSIAKTSQNLTHLQETIENGTPIVFFDRIAEQIQSDRVVVDDFDGAFQVTEHLIKMGCRRIAHLSTALHLAIGRNRRDGYIKALERHGIPFDNSLIIKCDQFEEGITVTDQLLKLPLPPDGIFAVNDWTAIGAMKAIKNAGLRIPEDVAIAGFTNELFSLVSEPELTTVDQNGFEMGQQAALLLLNRINGKDEYPAMTKIVKTKLLIRGSTRRIVS